jgi:hypothetical protein
MEHSTSWKTGRPSFSEGIIRLCFRTNSKILSAFLYGLERYLLGVLDCWLMRNSKILYHFQNLSVVAIWQHDTSVTRIQIISEILKILCILKEILDLRALPLYCGCVSSNFSHSILHNTTRHPNHSVNEYINSLPHAARGEFFLNIAAA